MSVSPLKLLFIAELILFGEPLNWEMTRWELAPASSSLLLPKATSSSQTCRAKYRARAPVCWGTKLPVLWQCDQVPARLKVARNDFGGGGLVWMWFLTLEDSSWAFAWPCLNKKELQRGCVRGGRDEGGNSTQMVPAALSVLLLPALLTQVLLCSWTCKQSLVWAHQSCA